MSTETEEQKKRGRPGNEARLVLQWLLSALAEYTEGLHVKRGTWNGMERGMEYGMERGTDVKCPNKPNKRVNWAMGLARAHAVVGIEE